MKITNWCRRLSVAIMAAGIWVPSMAYAVDIPLGDPGFEDFAVPAAGFAYADVYRPTSAWVDDLDSPPTYTQDDGDSNWLYSAAYAEDETFSRRASPRTGNQAMHGIGHYSAQETSAVFEAGKTYTFSMWAQGDAIVADDASSRVFLYMFDGSVPFSEASSLTFQRFAPDTGDFVNRSPAWSALESQGGWTQISLSYDVLPGAPEIGNPVGVAFWGADDAGLDDALLDVSATIPEPASLILVGLGGLTLLSWRRGK